MSQTPVLKPGQQIRLYATFLRDETQRLTVTGTPTGGAVRIAYDGEATDTTVPFDAQPVDVQDALERLRNVTTGNVLCTGGPWPATPIDVTLINGLGKRQRPLITLTENLLTGGTTPGLTVTRQVTGGQANPATVTYTITDPNGVDLVYTWSGTDNQITKVGPGQFLVTHDIAAAAEVGEWHWSVQGDTTVDDVSEGTFIVRARTAV
jgi:hypothetical protein